MAELDRDELIALLNRLGAEADEEVLEAARALHRNLDDAGLDWDDVVRPRSEFGGASPPAPAPESRKGSTRKAAGGRNASDDGKLIERIAARGDLSSDLRQELELLKRDLAEGEFGEMDRAYLHSLANRLGTK